MDERTESLIERGASLLIGLVLLLVGLIANVSDKAQTVLLAIAIPLISLATGIQLINSLPHAIIDAKNYVKNSGQPPTPPKILVDNSTELPEWLKPLREGQEALDERLLKLNKQQMEAIEKEAEKITEEVIRPDIEAPEPSLADVVFPEKEEPEIELKDHPADSELDEDVQETPKEE